jgi:hypothetical protein
MTMTSNDSVSAVMPAFYIAVARPGRRSLGRRVSRETIIDKS